jgi:tRNA(His) 5'-end guanylyltransferase
MPRLPVNIRLDGKCFSKFTKGLKRPYDKRMSRLMVELTKALVIETNALIGYTQSDEISLVLYSSSDKSQIYYDGRIQKMVGDLAAFATGVFNNLLPKYIPEKVSKDPLVFPRFDCRVWNTPDKTEAVNQILWREQDATKNSISMAASEVSSHKNLLGKSGSEKQEILFEKGINWSKYPNFFKRGTFVQKRIVEKKLEQNEIDNLPILHEAIRNPNLVIKRSEIRTLDMPSFSTVTNRIGVIFNGEDPEIE